MKVALLQLHAGSDKKANLKKAAGMARQAMAGGAKLVLFPENFNFRGDPSNKDMWRQAAEKIPGGSTSPFVALARAYKAAFVLGSILEKAAGQKPYNTSVFINSAGQITAKYRKIHLFDARIGDKIMREEDYMLAGRQPVTVRAGEFRIGLSICYDLRFPGLYQHYVRQGADVLTVPSCFTQKTGQAHWEVLLRARAIENLCYVLAPAQVGKSSQGVQSHGHSMIVSPWGEVLACGSQKREEIIFGTIHLEAVKKARAILPGMKKRGETR